MLRNIRKNDDKSPRAINTRNFASRAFPLFSIFAIMTYELIEINHDLRDIFISIFKKCITVWKVEIIFNLRFYQENINLIPAGNTWNVSQFHSLICFVVSSCFFISLLEIYVTN